MITEINDVKKIETVSRHVRVRFNIKSNAKGELQFDATVEASDSIDNIDELILVAEKKLDEAVVRLNEKYVFGQ